MQNKPEMELHVSNIVFSWTSHTVIVLDRGINWQKESVEHKGGIGKSNNYEWRTA